MNANPIELSGVDAVFEQLRPSHPDWCDGLYIDWIFRGHRDPSWQLVPLLWRGIENFSRFLEAMDSSLIIERCRQRLKECDLAAELLGRIVSTSLVEFHVLFSFQKYLSDTGLASFDFNYDHFLMNPLIFAGLENA